MDSPHGRDHDEHGVWIKSELLKGKSYNNIMVMYMILSTKKPKAEVCAIMVMPLPAPQPNSYSPSSVSVVGLEVSAH